MRFATLDEWLSWQERLHPTSIDLGLDRVRAVLAAMDLDAPPFRVVTVGGTNGKGSVAHAAANILAAAGKTVGLYTSPHLSVYNERVRIDGDEASDAEFCAAFSAVDEARGNHSLTYFEFGTLAAFEIFRRRGIEIAVLEVGLGGRLDAVNAIDADVAAVVSIGLDHTDWLGDSIDAIAREKAGIFRPGKPAIFGRGPAPAALQAAASECTAALSVGGRDYHAETGDSDWTWRDAHRRLEHLPLTRMRGRHQVDNAATAIAAVLALCPELPIAAVREGLEQTVVPGRLEPIVVQGRPEILLDVGHNAAAAEAIAQFLADEPRPTRVVLGMLADKDAAGFVAPLQRLVAAWYLAGLAGYRGQSAQELAERLPGSLPVAGKFPDVVTACEAALAASGSDERILVVGSFHTIGEFRSSGLYSGLTRNAAGSRKTRE